METTEWAQVRGFREMVVLGGGGGVGAGAPGHVAGGGGRVAGDGAAEAGEVDGGEGVDGAAHHGVEEARVGAVQRGGELAFLLLVFVGVDEWVGGVERESGRRRRVMRRKAMRMTAATAWAAEERKATAAGSGPWRHCDRWRRDLVQLGSGPPAVLWECNWKCFSGPSASFFCFKIKSLF
jgi:hypothetical protein